MADDDRSLVSDILREADADPSGAFDRLLPLIYEELRALARRHRWRAGPSEAHGTTSLVHEACLKLLDQTHVRWQNRAQFFYLASRAMRSIVIDRARHLSRQKRGGGDALVPFDDDLVAGELRSAELVALDEALDRLGQARPVLMRIVECRFFGGLTIDETAQALEVSPATVKRGWATARAWLYAELGPAAARPLAE